MRRHGRASVSRFIALLIVLQLHVLMIAVLAHLRTVARIAPSSEQATGILRFIDPSSPLARDPRARVSRDSTLSLAEPLLVPPPMRDIAPPTQIPGLPEAPVDWWSEAGKVADIHARQGVSSAEHSSSGRSPGTVPKCRKTPEFEWNPEPKRAGFSGVLPFVRVGKRCVIGLGFFGCGLGKLPEGNSHLFDGMREADPAESSVPDINCQP